MHPQVKVVDCGDYLELEDAVNAYLNSGVALSLPKKLPSSTKHGFYQCHLKTLPNAISGRIAFFYHAKEILKRYKNAMRLLFRFIA